MPNTVYKINDQDPLYNTMKLTPHSLITIWEKTKIYAHLCIDRSEISCGRRKREKRITPTRQ